MKKSILHLPIYKDKVDDNNKRIMNRDYNLGSFKAMRRIGEWFSVDCQIEIEKLALKTFTDNNTKAGLLIKILDKYNIKYSRLGGGTNRFGILCDEYAVKIALDSDGVIDNCIETITAMNVYPDSIAVYELNGSGCIEVTEYGRIFDVGDFKRYEYEIRNKLSNLSQQYLIGDVGLNQKNYVNWVICTDGRIAMMDFAYIYPIKYIRLTCDCNNRGNYLNPDNNFDKLICPICNKRWTFGQIRQRLSRENLLDIISHIDEEMYYIDGDGVKDIPINPLISPSRIKKHKNNGNRTLNRVKDFDSIDDFINDIKTNFYEYINEED